MHERGLAIDFTEGGRTLTRGSAGFQWLRANAGRFGFINLQSEPWHWSTNGN
jgi:D-alanyl-D-alanine carboxypeptidase